VYIPNAFEETRADVLHDLVRDYPLATLIIHTGSGLEANHVPLCLAKGLDSSDRLRGHIAKANPLASCIQTGIDALVIFQGPQAYISPSWYPTKQDSGRGVPTWNYSVVHATGTLRLVDDAAWIRAQVDDLTRQQEAHFANPWQVSDAPAQYLDTMMSAIVGIELEVAAWRGKWKVSQNQPPINRKGVIDKLRAVGDAHAESMAELIQRDLTQHLR
jgi:transcriptional regulator